VKKIFLTIAILLLSFSFSAEAGLCRQISWDEYKVLTEDRKKESCLNDEGKKILAEQLLEGWHDMCRKNIEKLVKDFPKSPITKDCLDVLAGKHD